MIRGGAARALKTVGLTAQAYYHLALRALPARGVNDGDPRPCGRYNAPLDTSPLQSPDPICPTHTSVQPTCMR